MIMTRANVYLRSRNFLELCVRFRIIGILRELHWMEVDFHVEA